jgi:hypothetical protein
MLNELICEIEATTLVRGGNLSIDIVQLVKEAMQKLGCGSAVDDAIDPHSPICISLNSLSDMFVEVEDDQVMFWSKLAYGGEAHLSRVAVDLIGHFLPKRSPAFICLRPLLTATEDGLLLHATVRREYLHDVENGEVRRGFGIVLHGLECDSCNARAIKKMDRGD